MMRELVREGRGSFRGLRARARGVLLIAGLVAALGSTARADAVNVALQGRARQSSTLPGGEAWRANDGSLNGNFSEGSIAHTNLGTTPVWFELDLGRALPIERVLLHNRTDCCHDRINGIRVELSSVPCDATPAVVASAPAVTSAPAIHDAPFAGAPSARYVCLRQSAGALINLAEVEVLSSASWVRGVVTGPDLALGGATINLARAAFARQSSTYSTYAAGLAIDGNSNGAFANGSVTHTNPGPGAWLEIGLGHEAPIDAVVVDNRSDCCADRLAGVIIELSQVRCDAAGAVVTRSAPLTASRSQRVEFADQRARYVCLRQPGAVPLSVAEVMVLAPRPAHLAPNFAYGRITAMSSTYGGAASYITDGRTDGNMDHGQLALTNNSTGQWMMVDLMATRTIGSVVIHNRIHYGADRLDGTRLQIADTACASNATLGITVPVNVRDSGPTVTVDLPAGTSGRFVCLRNTRAEYLTVAEIQVFPPLGPGVGYPAVARQSTPCNGRAAALAIDGDPLGRWAAGSVTQTAVDTVGAANDSGPWLEIDLLTARRIGSVVVRNRTDCCADNLVRARVELSLDRCDVATRRIVRDELVPILALVTRDTFKFPETRRAFVSGTGRARSQLDFVEAPAARFVCVRHDRRQILSVAEVEVYGAAPAINLARGAIAKPAVDDPADQRPYVSQSSTQHDGAALRAADASINGVYGYASVTRTANDDDAPWLELDLREAKAIRELAVWNRTDATPERLKGASVELASGPCAQSARGVIWSAPIPLDPLRMYPSRRTGFAFTSPKTARYVCVRKPSALLSVAEVQVFGVGDEDAPVPEPDPVVATAAAAAAAQLGAVEVPPPVATFTTAGATTNVDIRIVGAASIPCGFTATGPGAYTMTCAGGEPIAMTGTLANPSSYELTSTAEYGFTDLARRGLFPGAVASGLDAMASLIGVGRVQLALDHQRGFFITGTLAIGALGGGDPISKALTTTTAFLQRYAPGFDGTPTFKLVPSMVNGTAKLLLSLDVINTCAGPASIGGGIGAGFKLSKGALELAISAGVSGVGVSVGFSADALIKPTQHDPWLRYTPGIELTASTTGSSVVLKGQVSGQCNATCAADCSCTPSDCTAPWSPLGNPLVSLNNGYLELGAGDLANAVPVPIVKLAFDDVKIGSTRGAFAIGFDYEKKQFGFQLSADRMSLLGALGLLVPTAGLPLPSWLHVQKPRISFATSPFTIFNTTIPGGFRVAGGLDLSPVGLRGTIDATVPTTPTTGVDFTGLTRGKLSIGAPNAAFKLSIDTSDMLRKVLSVGGIDSVVRPIVEHALWIKRFEVAVEAGGTALGASARVEFSLLGGSYDVGFAVSGELDPVAIARQIAERVADEVGGPLAEAYAKVEDAAKVAAKAVADAFATGATVVVDGVVTANSKIVAASGTVADALEDAFESVLSAMHLPGI